jgi:hypothetical protein
VIHKGKNIASGDLISLQKLSETEENATLEEVFLKLTQEAQEEPIETFHEKHIKRKRRKGLFGFFGRNR